MNEARPHATAWFPPLPPAVTVREVAVSVSPGPGQRGVLVTKSMFREPIMQMAALVVGVVVVVGVSVRPGISAECRGSCSGRGWIVMWRKVIQSI